MTDLPDTVSMAALVSAFATLGIDLSGPIAKVELNAHAITVTEHRLTASGASIAAGNEHATVTTVIGIDRAKPAEQRYYTTPQP